ncbi:MAG: hypothetical protein H7Y39_01310 [Nitrospiraceae bacterium]|nr:hypothetical protein [Nitrospiraceae bacterium]
MQLHAAPLARSPLASISTKAADSPTPSKDKRKCPIPPQVMREGACPICGTTLEPISRSASDTSQDDALRRMSPPFWFWLCATVPLFLLAMGEMLPCNPIGRVLAMRAPIWVELVLATPVWTWAAWPFFVLAVEPVRHRSLNMFTLVGLGGALPSSSASWRRCSFHLPGAVPRPGRRGRGVLRGGVSNRHQLQVYCPSPPSFIH